MTPDTQTLLAQVAKLTGAAKRLLDALDMPADNLDPDAVVTALAKAADQIDRKQVKSWSF